MDGAVVDDLHFQRSLRDFKAVHLAETNPRSTPAELSTLISYRADRRRIVISNCGQFFGMQGSRCPAQNQAAPQHPAALEGRPSQ